MHLTALLSFALTGLATPGALAQDATPPGEAVDPSRCQVGPRTIEAMEQLVGTPTAGQPAATAGVATGAAATGEPEGQPADQATIDAVTDTYRELVACLNAGEYPRVFALYTDDYVRRALGEGRQDLSELIATPRPTGEQERTRLVAVRDVRTLDGDRVSALVEVFDPAVGGVIEIHAVLVRQGDRYLIDQETVAEAPEQGTPAAGTTAEQYEVVSYDIYFEPDELSIPANTDVVVSLPNRGFALHNFSIDALGIDVDIQPGATEQTTINAPAGEYEYYCDVPGHKAAGMVGTLTVR